MKKSVIILGKQMSGKSTKLRSVAQTLNTKVMTFSQFEKLKPSLTNRAEPLIIDDVITIEQLDAISCFANEYQLLFALASSINIKELSESILSTVEIVQL